MRGRKKDVQEGALPGVNPETEAYALRVWNGQSPSLPVKERIARVIKALEGQGLLEPGAELPPINFNAP